ncbi:MAG: RNA 3'-terminal phosphate cyclase [Candidatus Bathyarchaeota archaeon]|nr:MAG: RNA 3'-terminal phosphate cyclase [Candidatus Bathyarchaeota archaeon]
MLKIDGSAKSGSGTILRISVALASILREELHIYNIRKKRSRPGLRPQHLEATLTAAKLCNATIEGATLGSKELWFKPKQIVGGLVEAEIGTAGSIPMLLLTILPICAFAERPVHIHVTQGGTDVRHAPTIHYLQHVLLPMLTRMGLESFLEIHTFGYYPKGMGEVTLRVQPCRKLSSIGLDVFGKLERLQGLSCCTFLKERRVADRQAMAARKYLEARGFKADIHVMYDESNPLQKGSSIVLWAETDKGALLGGDAIGELRKPSEVVGQEAARNLVKELEAEATVDVHLADMLVPYVALAEGNTVYLSRVMTEHLDTNIWLVQKILGVEFTVKKMRGLYRIETTGG